VSGAGGRSVQLQDPPWEDGEVALEDAFFVDSGATYSGAPTTTVSGLTHLAGRQVAVLADGAVVTGRSVDGGGNLTPALASAASTIQIGLAFTARLTWLRPEVRDSGGNTVQGKRKRLVNLILRLLDTGGVKIDPGGGNRVDELIDRPVGSPMNAAGADVQRRHRQAGRRQLGHRRPGDDHLRRAAAVHGHRGDAAARNERSMSASIRPFCPTDVERLVLQPSQHVTLGIHRPVHTIEDGRELAELGPAWTAVSSDGRILACYGFGYQWPPSELTGGHALAWAMLGQGLGAEHVAITRFARDTLAASPIDRIEAIVRADVEAEWRWAELVGFNRVAELRAWGPEGETHLLYERVRSCCGRPHPANRWSPAARSLGRGAFCGGPIHANRGPLMQFAPLALMAAGSILKGVGSFQAGRQNRKIANVNARDQLIDGNAQATRIRDLARIQLGRQIGAQAESGFMVGTGSAIDSLVESQTNAELDAMDALRTAQSRSDAYRLQGASAYAEGKNDLIGGLVGAAGSVASGLQDYATAKKSAGADGLMAVQEQIYQPAEGLGSAAALPQTGPGAFGAGVGAAIEQAGGELHDSQMRAMRAERERQAQSELSEKGAEYAKLVGNYKIDTQGLEDTSAPDGAGHVDNVRNLGDQRFGEFLGSIQSRQVREHFAALAAGVQSEAVVDADAFSRGKRLKNIGDTQQEATDNWAAQVMLHPEPSGLADAVKERSSTIAALDAPDDVKHKLLKQSLDTVEYAYGQGLTRGDPQAAKAVFESGLLTHLTPEHRLALLNANETDLRIADADARRQLAQQAAQVRVDAQALTAKIGQGVLVGDDELAGVVKRAQALAAADPGLANVAETLQYDEGKLKYSRLSDKWTSAEWDQAINPLAAKVARGKASEDEQRELKILTELRPAKEARFKSDPDGFSAASGIPAPQVDLTAPDAGTVEARKSWARAFARNGGLVEPPYLNKDQLTEYRQSAAQGPVAEFEIAEDVKQTWGDAAPSVVRQIGGPGAADMKIMLGLNPAIAQRYKRGQQALDKKAVELNDDVGRQVFGGYVRGLPSDLQAPLFDAARKIAAGWMLDKGFTKAPANYDQVFGAALQYAAGRTGDVNDFNSPGGLAELNGRYAWLPADMTSNDFLRRVARAGPGDWVHAATDSQGNPVKSVPHYIGPDGRPKPYTKGDALRFSKGTLQSLDAGLYHLVDPMGHTVVDERGQPWTFDVRRLPRSHVIGGER
jgi:hypothetical protein